MDFHAIRYWARSELGIRVHPITLTTTLQQVTGGSPLRFGVFLPSVGSDSLSYVFGENPNSGVRFDLASQGFTTLISEDSVGQLITLPVWLASALGGQAVNVITLTYHPDRKEKMDEYIRRCLSQ